MLANRLVGKTTGYRKPWVSQVLTPRQSLVLLLKHFYSTHLWRSLNSFYITSQGLNNFPRKSQRKTVSWKSFRDYHWIFLCDLYASESLALCFEVLLVILLLHILDPANIYAWLVKKKLASNIKGMSVVSPTSWFAYIEVVSPTWPSRFAYTVRVDSPTLKSFRLHL